MRKFTTIQEISSERKLHRENPVIYTLLGTIMGEIDRLPIPRTETPSEDDIYKIIKKMYDAVEPYHDKDAELNTEYQYLKDFIRVQLSEQELETIISAYVLTTPDAKMGSVMAYLKENYAGQYDGKFASKVANFMLNKK